MEVEFNLLLFLSGLVRLGIDSLSSSSSPEHLFISGGPSVSLSVEEVGESCTLGALLGCKNEIDLGISSILGSPLGLLVGIGLGLPENV